MRVHPRDQPCPQIPAWGWQAEPSVGRGEKTSAGSREGNDSSEGRESTGRMGHRARGQEQQQWLPPRRGGEEKVFNSSQGQPGLSWVRLGQPQRCLSSASPSPGWAAVKPQHSCQLLLREYPRNWHTAPLPAFDLQPAQPGRAQRPPPHSKCSGAQGGHGALVITPRAALARLLSANSSEGPEPDLAPSFPWASGIPSVGCCGC